MSDEDSCGKKTCKNTGSCLFGMIWDVFACPFVSCYNCANYTCGRCCCKKNEYKQPGQK